MTVAINNFPFFDLMVSVYYFDACKRFNKSSGELLGCAACWIEFGNVDSAYGGFVRETWRKCT